TLVEKVARHLNLFDHYLGSDEFAHLVAEKKLSFIVERYGKKSFDYIGNSRADLHLWKECRHAVIVSSDMLLVSQLRRCADSAEHIRPLDGSRLKALFKAMRVHQWAKNLLLFAAIFLGHRFDDLTLVASAVQGFVAFSLCGSAVYILNDLVDLE